VASGAVIVEVFDEMMPSPYSEQDRRAGCFCGEDRRGRLLLGSGFTVDLGLP
jgi:hypothetical protein